MIEKPTPFNSINFSQEKTKDEKINSNYNNNNEISKLKNLNKELENKIKILNDELIKEKAINNELRKKIKNLENESKNDLISNNDEPSKIMELYEELRLKDKEINELKKLNSRYPLELLEGEKLISVIFTSTDKKIHYSIICKNTDTFSKIEKLLYDEFPGYKNSENIFTVNGNKINRYKTLEENKINNSDIITLKEKDEVNI